VRVCAPVSRFANVLDTYVPTPIKISSAWARV
jgi:hypothetical protein